MAVSQETKQALRVGSFVLPAPTEDCWATHGLPFDLPIRPDPSADTLLLAEPFSPRRRPLPGALEREQGSLQIVRRIARGGMGLIYLAKDAETGAEYALKTLRSSARVRSPLAQRRFDLEVEALNRLDHPSVVALHSKSVGPPHAWYAMEYVDGLDLRTLLRERQLPLNKKLDFFSQLCSAVRHAHKRGVVHRDLKPANVLVDSKGRIRLCDFGLARLSEREHPLERREVSGTPAYMPPEQFLRNEHEDRRVDVYALGVILYELLTGRQPFSGRTTSEIMERVLHGESLPPSFRSCSLSPDWDEICSRALAKAPDDRYSSVDGLEFAVAKLTRSLTRPSERAA